MRSAAASAAGAYMPPCPASVREFLASSPAGVLPISNQIVNRSPALAVPLVALALLAGCGGVSSPAGVGTDGPPPDSTAPDTSLPDGSMPDAPVDLPPTPDLPPDQPPPDSPPDRMTDAAPPTPTVVFSEIMYHPVLENDYEDQHEFIELHNRADFPFDVSGWKLGGDVTFTFPAGTAIPARGFALVARNRTALQAVSAHALDPATLHGNYTGQLDNGGGLVALLDGAGTVVEAVRYDDRFPWPIAADALGAGENWLAGHLLPLSAHQYRGVSLERASYDLPGAEVANWLPSPVDGPTPGRANTFRGTPPAIVETLSAGPVSGQAQIRAADEVVIRAGLTTRSTPTNVRVEYFVDDLERDDEARTVVAMTGTGAGGANAANLEARLPARASNSIVRYRILADQGAGLAPLSPRPSDPLSFHAYFVNPAITASQPPYHLFVKATDWGTLWTNVDFSDVNGRRVVPETIGGTTVRCRIRDGWDGRVPAVFVSDGQVHDVRVRYQGSRWNRTNGNTIDLSRTSISPLPEPMMISGGNPVLRALSWNISFPRFSRFQGTRDPLILNKLNQSCPGLDAAVGAELYAAAGLPASNVRYRRLYVNGGYYDYALDIEVPGEQSLRRTTPTGQRVGDLFKASGNNGTEEGPWGRGDGAPLAASCVGRTPSFQPLERYAATYERKTWEWKTAANLQSLIDGLHSARVAGNLNDSDAANDNLAPVRSFLAANFDSEKMLDYLAIRNWAEPWDDFFHNYYLYQDAGGRWSMVPWDQDREFGENFGWNARKSFFIGERGDPDARNADWNRVKDAFIRAYRSELIARLNYLATDDPASTDPRKGLLSPRRFRTAVQNATSLFNQADWTASPVQNLCNFDQERTTLLNFGEERHSALADVVACASRSCGLKGEYFGQRNFNAGSLQLTRIDPVVQFDWGTAAPATGGPADSFQVRWTGTVTPAFAETYRFYTQSDDGVRLWVNGQIVIDAWTNHTSREDSGTIALAAGQAHDLRLEYYDNNNSALIRLSWSSPSQPKQLVPARVLTPAP